MFADEITWETINCCVAWWIVDVFIEAHTQSAYLSEEVKLLWSKLAELYQAVHAGIEVLAEKVQLLFAVGIVYAMWLIAVFPLIVHGEMIPRGVRAVCSIAVKSI